jgi:hypothetical protein
MNKGNVLYAHDETLLSYKEQNYAIFRKMDGTQYHHVKQNKPDSQSQASCAFSHMWILEEKKDKV